MKHSLWMFAAVAAVTMMQIAPAAAQPAESSSTSQEAFMTAVYKPKFPSSFRLAPLAGGGILQGYSEKDTRKIFWGGLLAGVGSGMFTAEAGVGYVNLAVDGQIIDGTSAQHAEVAADYVGIPLWVKYNYIEKPLASFFVKAGAMPLFLMNQSSAQATLLDQSKMNVQLADSDVLMVGGIGGTAPLGERSAFILDISYFMGTIPTTQGGSTNQGGMLSLGVSFDL